MQCGVWLVDQEVNGMMAMRNDYTSNLGGSLYVELVQSVEGKCVLVMCR